MPSPNLADAQGGEQPEDWFAGQGVQGYTPYELGGVAGPSQGPVQGPPQGGAGPIAGSMNGQPLGGQPQGQPPPQGNPAAGAPQGFDPSQQVGHDGTINGMNREQYRDAWMASGASNPQEMQAFLAQHGGSVVSGNGTVRTPFGEDLDMMYNARGSAQTGSGGKPTWGGGGGGPAMNGPQMGGGMMAPGDMMGGGGPTYNMASGGAPGGGGGGGNAMTGEGAGWDGQKYTAQTIDMPGAYNPTATAGPENYTPQQIKGPEALQAQQISGEKFGGVTAADMEADPGYQFRLKQSLGALQNSAAAKGLLRSTGTLQGLAGTAGEMASQEYGNVYNRKFGEHTNAQQDRLNVAQANNGANAQAYGLTNQYQQGAQIANAQNAQNAWSTYQGMNQQNNQFNAARTDTANQQNFSNRFSVQNANNANAQSAWQGNTNAQLGQGGLALGYQNAQNTRDVGMANVGVGMANVGLGYHTADQNFYLGNRNADTAAYSAGTGRMGTEGQLGLGWANYGLNADQQQFNQGYSLADMGMRAAGQQGAYGGAYGANAGGYATSAGNAAAAGTVGRSNAWNQGLGGAFNAAAGAYGAYQQRPQAPAGAGGLYLDPTQGQRT